MAGKSNLRREIAGLVTALLDDARTVDVVALFGAAALTGVMLARVLAAGRRPRGR